jgi:hypothetical protein
MQEYKFVFICGLHRSGTSILFKCLKEHPAISGFKDTGVPEDEGQHLQSVYPPAKCYGGAGKFGFAPETHLTESSSLITEENQIKLFAEWSKYWDLEKPILLEKSPPNLIRTRFLQAMFPNSYFIIIQRHPIAVSYATHSHTRLIKFFNRNTIYSLMNHWLLCHEIFEDDKPYLNKCFVIKYEYFIKQPDLILSKIYEFIGLEQYFRKEYVIDNNKKYFIKWNKLQSNVILRNYKKYLIKRFEKRINKFSYSLYDI